MEQDKMRQAEERHSAKMAGMRVALGAPSPRETDQCSERAAQDPLSVRINTRLRRFNEEAQDLMRIQSILREHPEFEMFIELQTLLNRRGL